MKTYISSGDTVPALAPSGGVTVDVPVLMGALFGVPATTAAVGVAFELKCKGIFSLPKASGAIAFGAAVYWDDTAKDVTTTSSGNTLIGHCTLAALSAATTCRVRLS